MEINIGFVIQKLRKLKGLTQEQVADAMGVSKAAVSKWESGNTYPDITLLAPLARLLDTNINELLEFNSKLTEKEINSIATLCEREFLKGDYFSAYDHCEKQLKRYSNIAELKLRIASLYWQYTVLLKDDEEASNNMIKRACEVFEEASEASDADIKEAALHNIASLYMMRENYDSALKTAERLNPKSNDTMLLLATIYRNKGENDNAKKLYQRILFKNIQTCGLVLQSLSRVAEKESNIKDAQLFLETVIKLNTLFKVENHADTCALQLAELYAKNNDKDKAIVMLNRYIRFIHNLIENGNKGLNSSKFFSEIQFKSVGDGKSEFMKQHLADAIMGTSAFDELKENEEFKKIIEELRSL
ncbi:helix-turn-helix domain-containing protein [Clostridium sp. UBA1056]|uniref:helix-turn-helix domain-containing protein n=1 Tax=unclassified Clostridium TaxID=2614128 RepID=UPI0032168034